MRKVRKISNLLFLKEALVSWLVLYMALLLPAQIVMADANPAADALPSGLGVNQGINTPVVTGLTMDITQTANNAIANWQNFDIGSNATVNINQPSANAAMLNRINGSSATGIMGQLNANGKVFIVNPAGIVFGSTATVNVSQLVASSLHITDADFLNGAPYQFTNGMDGGVEGGPVGEVINEGYIGSGYIGEEEYISTQRIALIGRNVINRGILMAEKSVVMAAGDAVLLSETGGKVAVEVALGEDWVSGCNYQVDHTDKGEIGVEGDDVQVILAAGDIWSSAYIGASGNGSASVVMKAEGEIDIADDVEVEAYADSPAVATLDLIAGGTIEITDEVDVEAYGSDVDNATAKINVNAGEDLVIYGTESDAGLAAEAEGLNTNTAQITVHAGGHVQANASYGGEAYIYSGTYGGKTNKSSVDITAGGDVRVNAYDDGFAGIEAESYAYPYPEGPVTSTVSTTINAGGKVVARADYDSEVDIDSEAWNGTNNTATTSITAGEYVKAKATEYSDASISAESHGGTESNTAAMNVTVTGAEGSENYRNGGVYVIADYDSEADIFALADAEIEYGEFSYQVLAQSTSNHGTAVQTAQTVIHAAQDVEVTSEGEYSEAFLGAEAYNGLTNTAATTVNAGGDVKVQSSDYDSSAYISSEAEYGQTNTAAVGVDAGGNVLVIAHGSEDYTEAGIEAYANNATQTNTANIDITANNVLVVACEDGNAEINAYAGYIPSYMPSADGYYDVEPDGTSSNASVKIETFKVEIEEPEDEPEPQPASLKMLYDMPFDCETILADYIDGGHVAVLAFNGGDARIQAESMSYNQYAINNSDVLICAEGIVAAGACSRNESSTYANIRSLASYAYDNNASLGIGAMQGLGSLAYGYGAEASISSEASMTSAGANNADLVACTGGPLAVLALEGAYASIETNAYSSSINNASTGVCADSLVVVGAANDGTALISSNAGGYDYDVRSASSIEGPVSSTAETIVVSKNSGVAVVALDGGEAGIDSMAGYAANSDAYTGVCAKDHIIVAAGIEDFFYNGDNDIKMADNGYGSGGTAYISSAAGSQYIISAAAEDVTLQQEEIETTANAHTAVVSREGGVIVADMTSYNQYGSAAISSEATGAYINNAYTGVAAGADLTPASLDDEVEIEEPANIIEYIELMYRYELPIYRGEVGVYAQGPESDARIISEAAYGFENNAQTVVCAPGEVSVESDGWEGSDSIATIKSWAHGGEFDNAKTQVYASEVYVEVDTLRYGNGIGAYGDGGWINIDNNTSYDGFGDGYPSDGGWDWVNGEHQPILFEGEGEGSTLIINGYSSRQDCPDCPPCPDCPCQDEALAPVAPLAQFVLPRVEGCPALTLAAAMELGTSPEALQVAIGNSLALNPSIQPCQACSNLVSAATILKDADGSRMAAMAYVFNQVAPADAPFTPEMGAAIATAFSQNAELDARYASAMEYVDAFVQYVTVVDQDLRAPVGDGDSVAFVMNKYGNALAESGNSNMAAYIMMQMQQ